MFRGRGCWDKGGGGGTGRQAWGGPRSCPGTGQEVRLATGLDPWEGQHALPSSAQPQGVLFPVRPLPPYPASPLPTSPGSPFHHGQLPWLVRLRGCGGASHFLF